MSSSVYRLGIRSLVASDRRRRTGDECILGGSGYPMQTAIVILVVLLGTLALPVVAGAVYQAIETWRDRGRFPPPGRLVRFNERRMHIHVTGEGTPTVVFESGMGASCLSWTLVQPQVAQFSRAVSYDRAGHGWSDPAPEPRTARQIAQEQCVGSQDGHALPSDREGLKRKPIGS